MRELGLTLFLMISAQSAWATPDVDPEFAGSNSKKRAAVSASPLSPAEVYRRTQAVLNYYGVPAERSMQSDFDPLFGKQSQAEFRRVSSHLDMSSEYLRYFEFLGSELRVSSDRDSRAVTELQVELGTTADRSVNESRLARRVRSNPPDRILHGLKIALDPGHMGGDLWDTRTGKFVRDPSTGRKLSEGVLTLQTALLLEERFKSLGAEVLLTHRGLHAVSSMPYEDLPVKEFALEEIRSASLLDWFQALLTTAPAGPALYRAFDQSAEIRKAFAESARWKYFFNREDLDARSQMIEAFDADLTLLIHFDVSVTASRPNDTNPRGYNATKAYVAGAFESVEFATGRDRAYFAQHAVQSSYWWESVNLGQSIVTQLSQQLSLPYDRNGGGVSKQIVPGVWARNLALTRRLPGRVFSFLECMYYNTNEFDALSRQTNPMLIDGVSTPYSDRLGQVAKAIGDGLVGYVSGLSARLPN